MPIIAGGGEEGRIAEAPIVRPDSTFSSQTDRA